MTFNVNQSIKETAISDYISACLENNITSRVDMCEQLKSRIEKIDQLLHEADALRTEKIRLLGMLREFGDDSVKRKRLAYASPEIALDDDSQEAHQLHISICKAINEFGPMTNRELIQKIGSYQQEREIFRAIKFLGEKDIICRVRNNNEVKLDKGSNWENHPN